MITIKEAEPKFCFIHYILEEIEYFKHICVLYSLCVFEF